MRFNGLHSVSSLGCPELSLGELLALAVRHGIGAVELRTLGGLDVPSYLRKEFGTPAAFAGFVAAQPVRVIGFGTSMSLVGPGRKRQDLFLEFLPWAEALGGVRLRVFDGGKNWTDAEFAEAVAFLHWWQAERATRGWRSDIMIETHDFLFTAAVLQRFLAVAPKGTAILWDTHHTWRIGGESPTVTWRAVRDSIVHLHVKDSVTLPDPNGKYAYVLPGAGEFPMRDLLTVLETDRFGGPLSLEWERQWHPTLPPLDEALAHASVSAWW